MNRPQRDAYQTWLWGEALLLALLAAALTLFVVYPNLREPYDLTQVRLVVDTVVMLAALVVAVLAAVRVSVEGRWSDVLLCSGFALTSATVLAFSIAPLLDGRGLIERDEGWAGSGGKIAAAVLIAVAPFVGRRTNAARRALTISLVICVVTITGLYLGCMAIHESLPQLTAGATHEQPLLRTATLAVSALLALA